MQWLDNHHWTSWKKASMYCLLERKKSQRKPPMVLLENSVFGGPFYPLAFNERNFTMAGSYLPINEWYFASVTGSRPTYLALLMNLFQVSAFYGKSKQKILRQSLLEHAFWYTQCNGWEQLGKTERFTILGMGTKAWRSSASWPTLNI